MVSRPLAWARAMAATFSGETVPPVCRKVPSRSLAIKRVTIVTNFPDI
jgi:hypothetical protein